MQQKYLVSQNYEQNIDVVVDGNKCLLLTKALALPVAIAALCNGRSELWVANGQAAPQIIPKSMVVGNAEALNTDCVNTSTITKPSNMFQTESSCVSVDYSSMLSPILTAEQRKELLDLLQKIWEVFD